MNRDLAEPHAPSLWDAWLVQQSVLRALILREFQSRFGRHNIGFLWLVVEPLILASVVTAIHFASPSGHGRASMGPFPFSVLGYCLLIVFRSNFSRAEGALETMIPLLSHSQIKPIDVMLARFAIETCGTLSAFIILMSGGILFGLADLPDRPLYLLLAITQISVWSFGLSLVVAAHTHTNHVVGRFVHPTAYFMFPLSGAFITMSFLPAPAREYMMWNPMMGMFETARYGQFQTASPDYMYPGYVLAHCALSLYWGLFSMRRVQRDIHVV